MKKRLLSLALLSTLSATSFAANTTFQATVNAISDAAIAQTAALHFGAMQPTFGSQCTMDNTGAVSGACDASNANIAIGLITVSGLIANVPLNVTVTGAPGTNVDFDAQFDVNNATATHDGIADGTVTAVTTNASGDDLTIDVYGQMQVTTALNPGDSYTADYTVDVSFQ